MPLSSQQKAKSSLSRQLNRGSLALGKLEQIKASTVSKTEELSKYQHTRPLFSSWQESRRNFSGVSDQSEKNDPWGIM